VPYRQIKHLPSIRNIPDDLWDEIKLLLPSEKANNTVGRPIVPFRKVVDGILYVKDRMSMENASKRTWFWLRMS
jgi:hypothetical protein